MDGEIVNFLFDRLHELLGLTEYSSSGAYWRGLAVGFAAAVAIGWLWGAYRIHSRQNSLLFRHYSTQLTPQPQRLSSMLGCSRSGCILVSIVAVLLFMLSQTCMHVPINIRPSS